MKVTFEKVDVSSSVVVELAKVSGEKVEKCASFINNQRYRKAYNVAKLAEQKVMKAELAALEAELAKVKGGK